MTNSFISVFGSLGGGADATKLPLTGGTLTGGLTINSNAGSTCSLTTDSLSFSAEENPSSMSIGLTQLSFGYDSFQSATYMSGGINLINSSLRCELEGGTLKLGYYTDGSNYVRASLSSSSTLVTLAAETAGTGADNVGINITTAGTGLVNLATQTASSDVVAASTHTARIKIGGTEYKILLSTV